MSEVLEPFQDEDTRAFAKRVAKQSGEIKVTVDELQLTNQENHGTTMIALGGIQSSIENTNTHVRYTRKGVERLEKADSELFSRVVKIESGGSEAKSKTLWCILGIVAAGLGGMAAKLGGLF